jgi:predicted Zn-ribbon and HTH transcriptional regulator
MSALLNALPAMTALLNTAAAADTRPNLEVADIVRRYGAAYQNAYSVPLAHQRVLQAIADCRTATLGGHLEACNHCGYQRPVYNSCRNRHCPKCQTLARAQWLADRQAELLPVGYFHNVFTLPHEFNDLSQANQRVVYGLLFRSVAATLQAFAADPRYGLGGQAGFTAVLHTWDQKLLYHVHLHCVIAGGALAFDGSRWIPARAHYLFPVRELSRAYRSRFLEGLRQAYQRNELVFPGRLAALQEAASFAELLARLAAKEWVVYSQPPFGGPDKVLEYLSRYTHRVAISNGRLLAIANGGVTFTYRDRRDGNRSKELTITAAEFLRRFLLHVTPSGLCRIRHYGFLSNRAKEKQLPRCRALLGQRPPPPQEPVRDVVALLLRFTGVDVTRCPRCQQGRLVGMERILPTPTCPVVAAAPVPMPESPMADSS